MASVKDIGERLEQICDDQKEAVGEVFEADMKWLALELADKKRAILQGINVGRSPAEAFRARGGKGASAPETRLVDAFLERNPTYKGVAIDLLGEGAEYVPLAFARRQVRLMEGGMTEAAARDLLEKEMGLEAGGREQYAKQCRDTLSAVQNEEEAALRTALVSARKMEEEARAAARRGPRAT